jgi:hypothetical protein
MKNSILLLSVGVTILCGLLLIQKNREMADLRLRMEAADQARAASAARAEQEEKWTKNLQKRLRQTRPEVSERTTAREMPTNAPERKAMSKMFRDAMMKEALEAEAKVGAAKGVQQLFDAGLASRLGLSDDQSAALRQLLLQRTSILWEQMMIPMATGEIDPANMSSEGQGIKQAIDQNAGQIRDLLGDDGYNTWQWFDKTQPERDQANGFSANEASAGQPLTPEQQSQLVDLMTAQRASFNFQYDLGDPATLDFQNWYDNFTPEKIDAYQQDMEQLNGSIGQQALAVLTPEQGAELNQFLARQLFQSLVTIRSTQAMMAGGMP